MKRLAAGMAALGMTASLALPPAETAHAQIDPNPCNGVIGKMWNMVKVITRTEVTCEEAIGYKPANNVPEDSKELYVALGDSVPAGLGLPVPERRSLNDATCGISKEAYPALVAAKNGKTLINLACSGATAGDMVTEQHLSGTTRDLEPQLDGAFANGTPDLITITAGANDMRWFDFARKCGAARCGTAVDRFLLSGLQSALELKLVYAMEDIEERSNGQPPQVIVTGYYNPVSLSCVGISPEFTRDEIEWFSDKIGELNAGIKTTVEDYENVTFVPVDFTGHDMCSADPWVQRPTDPAPFHPNARGQQAYADAIQVALDKAS